MITQTRPRGSNLALLLLSAQILCASLSLAAPQAADAQTAGDGVGLIARLHFNTQTSDFERSREFYRLLGYTRGVGNFPKTNTHLMARSLGMYDLCTYELERIEVISIPDANGSTSIDLIKFAVPYTAEPPYALPNHLGMAYAALSTADFSDDYETLKQQGVKFLSEPFGEPGNRFVFMQDPDGVFLKLVEVKEEAAVTSNQASTNSAKIDIQAMPYIGINVSDFDLALGFYRSLGYTISETLPTRGTLAEARAYGLDRAFEIRGADISLATGDGNTLRIMQWLEPFDGSPTYPAPINHIGINRIALAVSDLDAAVATLENQGVKFLSEIAPCCSGTGLDTTGIINAIDPDGVFVELVGPIRQRPPQPVAEVCSAATQAKTGTNFKNNFTRLN